MAGFEDEIASFVDDVLADPDYDEDNNCMEDWERRRYRAEDLIDGSVDLPEDPSSLLKLYLPCGWGGVSVSGPGSESLIGSILELVTDDPDDIADRVRREAERRGIAPVDAPRSWIPVFEEREDRESAAYR